VTIAGRARIERGVVVRLREAPDGRPRREQLAAALRETLVDQRLVVPAGELRLLERWLEDRLFGLGELAPLLRDDRSAEVPASIRGRVDIEHLTFSYATVTAPLRPACETMVASRSSRPTTRAAAATATATTSASTSSR